METAPAPIPAPDGVIVQEPSEALGFGDGPVAGPCTGDACSAGEGVCGDVCNPGLACIDRPYWGLLTDQVWVRGEYLLWWTHGFAVPPLVTTSPAGTDRTVAGVLGQPGTSILVGNSGLANESQSGGRINIGYWFDPCATSGIQASYFGLGDAVSRISFDSQSTPILARPFFNVTPDTGVARESAALVAFPEEFSGNIQVVGKTNLEGVEVLWRHAVARRCDYRVDWLAGWRFNHLDEDVLIQDFRTALSSSLLVPDTTLQEFDRFHTLNRFNGGELGVVAEIRRRCWTLEGTMKLALGNTHSTVDINGSTTTTTPVSGGPPDVTIVPNGLLAQRSNIGSYARDQFSVVPELGLLAGYDLTYRLRATVGYTFMYWSGVARPGDQIDRDVSVPDPQTGLQGAARPEFRFVGNDVWIQGLNVGLDYRF